MPGTASDTLFVQSDTERAFSKIRQLHILAMCLTGAWFLLAVQLPSGSIESPLRGRPDWIWGLRVGLALSAITIPLMVEAILRRPSFPKQPASGWVARLPVEARKLGIEAVLRMAFYEAIGLYGLLMFLAGGSWVDLVAFVGFSLALLAWRWPRRGEWEERLRANGNVLTSNTR